MNGMVQTLKSDEDIKIAAALVRITVLTAGHRDHRQQIALPALLLRGAVKNCAKIA